MFQHHAEFGRQPDSLHYRETFEWCYEKIFCRHMAVPVFIQFISANSIKNKLFGKMKLFFLSSVVIGATKEFIKWE